MRYPPSIRWPLKCARVYRGVSIFIAIILLAIGAVFLPAIGHFEHQNPHGRPVLQLLAAGAALVVAWCLLRAAWRSPRGQLVYSQGQWLLRLESVPGQPAQEILGTLRLHLDLQLYMLARFEPATTQALQPVNMTWKRALQWMVSAGRFFSNQAQGGLWVHFEPWQRSSGSQELASPLEGDWLSLRRAVYAPQALGLGRGHEKLAF